MFKVSFREHYILVGATWVMGVECGEGERCSFPKCKTWLLMCNVNIGGGGYFICCFSNLLDRETFSL